MDRPFLLRKPQTAHWPRRFSARAIVVVLLLAGSMAPSPALAAPHKKYLTIGIRGSGETQMNNGHRNIGQPNQAALNLLFGYGPLNPHKGNPFYERTVWAAYGRPRLTNGDVVSASNMDIEALRYPAIATDPGSWLRCTESSCGPPVGYYPSVDQGADRLVSEVSARLRKRPDTRILIFGYSQGAHVFDRAASRLNKYASSIAAVVLFGNPKFRPNSPTAAGPDAHPVTMIFDQRVGGLLSAGGEYPSALRSKILSWCRAGDPICQRPTTPPPWDFSQHLSYDQVQDSGWASSWMHEQTITRRTINRRSGPSAVQVTAFKGRGFPTGEAPPLPGVKIRIRKLNRYVYCDAPTRVTGEDGIALFTGCPSIGPGTLWLMPEAICPPGHVLDHTTGPSYAGTMISFGGLRPGHTRQLQVYCAPTSAK